MKIQPLVAFLAFGWLAQAQDLNSELLDQKLKSLDLQSFHFDAGELNDNLAELTAQATLLAQAFPFDKLNNAGHDDREYQAGTSDLDARRYDSAIRHFDAVIERKAARADGAYYWKAYAQERSGHRTEALATLAQLRQNFPQSRWLNDAQSLQAEIHSNGGRAANPGAENNEELKLIAINGLMQSDPGRAVPILKSLLNGNQAPGVKDRALFVLSQSGSSEAGELLMNIARGKTDPDLQLKAVRYIGMMGDGALHGELASIYASSGDVTLKREIIRSYLLSGSKAQLLAAAKGERNNELRSEAIRTLAQTGAKDELWTLYKSETAPELRREIVQSMLLDGDSSHLLEIAKSDKDPSVRKTAIKTLALTGSGNDSGALLSLYRAESDESVKRELIRGMFLQQNAKSLVELARAEKNPELKREIVQQLSLIHSKEATDYLMEILK